MSRLKDVYLQNPGDKEMFHLHDLISVLQAGNTVLIVKKDGTAISLPNQTIYNIFDKLFDAVQGHKL